MDGLEIDGNGSGPAGSNYVSTFNVVAASADVAVTATADNLTPIESGIVHITVTAAEISGPASVTGVEIADLLPAGLSFVSATATAGSYNSASGMWLIPTLAATASQSLVITAQVQSGTVGQTLTDTASLVSVDQGDTNPANNAAQVAMQVVPYADLALTSSASTSKPGEGTDFYFYTTITDNGEVAATNVQVTETLPAGVRLVSASPVAGSYNATTGVWTLPTIAKGTSYQLTL